MPISERKQGWTKEEGVLSSVKGDQRRRCTARPASSPIYSFRSIPVGRSTWHILSFVRNDPSRGASKLIICLCFIFSHAMWICYVRSRRYKSQKHKKYFTEGNYENHV